MFKIAAITLTVVVSLGASARAQSPTPMPASSTNPTPTYRINVVSRTTQAVSYKHRSGATKINFQGTDLMPAATGQAKVESKRGAMKIEAEFFGLGRPGSFGSEYLTYVLWAISPEGRPINIGEVLVGNNQRSKVDVSTDLQAFALIVTAEPYYAVRRPSNVVVLENSVRSDTAGSTESVDAKYELIDRGGYIPTGYKFDPVVLNAKLPMEFYEARNAIRIAQYAGAEKYATTSYEKAVHQMSAVDAMAISKHEDKKTLIPMSREVVQTSEDAREIAMKHIDEERAEAERMAAAGREADAKTRANDESQRRLVAEIQTADAVRERNEADRNNLDAQVAAHQASNAQAEAEQARNAANRNNVDAQAAAQRAAGAQADAEKSRNDAQMGQMAAEADSDRNRAAAASSDAQLRQAINDREELRARLLAQFNLILETRDTARGLVVNMSDVLFDSGKFTLRPLAREKLAKISGIVLAYPTLKLAVEGNTDSVGTESYNQQLSEQRAEGVRSYLTHEGIPESSTTAEGFGKSRPIASNDTAEGRQQNRRVELVVSGEVIGNKLISLRVPSQPVTVATSPR
jgi:outer membrane protein OmpA-like peptidoglycan-associated protein